MFDASVRSGSKDKLKSITDVFENRESLFIAFRS
jgi:hypothetical protein